MMKSYLRLITLVIICAFTALTVACNPVSEPEQSTQPLSTDESVAEKTAYPTGTSYAEQTVYPTDTYAPEQTAEQSNEESMAYPDPTAEPGFYTNGYPYPVDLQKRAHSIELLQSVCGYAGYHCQTFLLNLDRLRYDFNRIQFSDFSELTVTENPVCVENILRIVGDDGQVYNIHVSSGMYPFIYEICDAEGNCLYLLIL